MKILLRIIQVHSYSMSYGYILVCIKCHLGTLFESVIWVHFNSLSYGTFFVCHMVRIFIERYLGMILTECLCLRAVFVYKLFLCYKGLFCCMSVGFIFMFVSLMCIFLLKFYNNKYYIYLSVFYTVTFSLVRFFLKFHMDMIVSPKYIATNFVCHI